MLAIAVPVINPSGHYIGAIAVHGPKARFPIDKALSALPLLKQAAKDVSDALFAS